MEQPAATTAETPETKSRIDDYVDIFFSPSSVFERRTGKEWVQPLLVLIGVSIVLYFALLPANTIAMRTMMEARLSQAGAQAADAARAMQRANSVMRWVNVVFVPVVLALTIALFAAALWIIGRLFDIRLPYRDTFLVATFAHFIAIPEAVARGISLILSNRDGTVSMVRDTSFGVLRFVQADSPVVRALLARFDVFPVWEAVLWAIGLAVLAKVPRGRALTAALVLWLLVALPGMVIRMVSPGAAAGM